MAGTKISAGIGMEGDWRMMTAEVNEHDHRNDIEQDARKMMWLIKNSQAMVGVM